MSLILAKPTGAKLLMRKGCTITSQQKTDPDGLAYLAEVERADGQALEAGVRTAVIDFVAGCKADGIWSAIKASCILAGARTLNGALVPLVGVAPVSFNFVSGDYDRKTGLVGDGSTKYLNSKRGPKADGVNNAHISVYASSYGTSATLIGGSTVATYVNRITTTNMRINSTTIHNVNQSTPFVGGSRASSGSYTGRTGGVSTNVTASSVDPGTGNVVVFANNVFAIESFCNCRLAFYSVGSAIDLGLLDARVANLVNAIGTAIP